MADLRKPFVDKLMMLAEKDPRVVLLTGDLGYSFLEPFAEKYPYQYANCGIAEQNMVGMAAGMARRGLKPYVYSGSVFLLTRSYEQVRDDVAYNNTNVKLIGTGANGFLGFSHNYSGNESDLKLVEPLPNIVGYWPSDKQELELSLGESYKVGSPTYIRL